MRYLRSFRLYESVASLSKVRYRQIDVDIRDDIKDIFLDLGDDGYDVRFRWEPLFSEDKISSGNYPFVMVSCKGGVKTFPSEVLVEYMKRLELVLGDEYSVQLEVMKRGTGNYYLGKSGKVYNSIVYRLLMVRL